MHSNAQMMQQDGDLSQLDQKIADSSIKETVQAYRNRRGFYKLTGPALLCSCFFHHCLLYHYVFMYESISFGLSISFPMKIRLEGYPSTSLCNVTFSPEFERFYLFCWIFFPPLCSRCPRLYSNAFRVIFAIFVRSLGICSAACRSGPAAPVFPSL